MDNEEVQTSEAPVEQPEQQPEPDQSEVAE